MELSPVQDIKWVPASGAQCLFDPAWHYHFSDGTHPSRTQMLAIREEWDAYFKRTFLYEDGSLNAMLRSRTREKTLDLERALARFDYKEEQKAKFSAEHYRIEENAARQKLEMEILEHVERNMHQWIHDFTVDCLKAEKEGKSFKAELLLGFVPSNYVAGEGSYVCVEHDTGRIGRLVHQIRHVETGFGEAQ